jgi:hypothetical protein
MTKLEEGSAQFGNLPSFDGVNAERGEDGW